MGGERQGYRQSAGTVKAQRRKAVLLAAVADDLAEHGLVDFSLRRSAKAAGTTHKVLLYHFHSAEELLGDAVAELRRRRVSNVRADAVSGSVGDRAAALWPIMADDSSGFHVLEQAIGLAMYDPDRYSYLATEATASYREALLEICPPEWPASRRAEVAALILASMRGFLVELRVSGETEWIRLGIAALRRALDNEPQA